MATVIRFVATLVGVAFVTAFILLGYESCKAGGFDKQYERLIAIYSLVVGLLGAVLLHGFGGGGMRDIFLFGQ